jgi:hypothetical protein
MNGTGHVNDVEVCLVALRRSGHHAVIAWIAEQFPGPALLLNNLRPGEDPFAVCRERLERAGRREEAARLAAEERSPGPRKLVIVNYEDCELRRVFSEEERARREAALGPSRRRLNVIVLRDHLNLFASRIRRVRLGSARPRESLPNALRARRLYPGYAREFLGETRHAGEEAIAISFNRWVRDEGYRRELSARLGGDYAEATLDRLAPEGAGSSFDGTRYLDRAREMDVLGRWRGMERNLFFHAVVNDRRLLRLTERIFGPTGYPRDRVLKDAGGAIVFPAYLALDRLVRFLARHDVFP